MTRPCTMSDFKSAKVECHEKQRKGNDKTGTSDFKSAKVECHEKQGKGNDKTGTSDFKSAKVECHEKQHKGNDKTGTSDFKSAKVECHEEQHIRNGKTGTTSDFKSAKVIMWPNLKRESDKKVLAVHMKTFARYISYSYRIRFWNIVQRSVIRTMNIEYNTLFLLYLFLSNNI